MIDGGSPPLCPAPFKVNKVSMTIELGSVYIDKIRVFFSSRMRDRMYIDGLRKLARNVPTVIRPKKVTHTQSLDAVAIAFGFRDWKALQAAAITDTAGNKYIHNPIKE